MRLIHCLLYPLLLATVLALYALNVEWERIYDNLQAEQLKAATVHLRVLDNDVWLLINERHLYQFENACMADKFET